MRHLVDQLAALRFEHRDAPLKIPDFAALAQLHLLRHLKVEAILLGFNPEPANFRCELRRPGPRSRFVNRHDQEH